MSLRPRDFGYYEDQESWLYEKGWDDWAVIPGKPQSGGGKDGLVPGTPDIDPIKEYDDWDDDTEQELFSKVYRWGENPVRTAMDKLELKDINSQESLIAVDEWLIENYGDIFNEEEEEEKREPYVPTIWEPTELEITDYVPTETLKIQQSDVVIGSAPQPPHPMKIGGIKPTIETTYFSQQRVKDKYGTHVGTVNHKNGNPYTGSWKSPDGSWSSGKNLLDKYSHLNSYDDLLGVKGHTYGNHEHVKQEHTPYNQMQINPFNP